jgi:peptidoglycan-N-acetylglucosamine deacetylase
MSSHSDIPRGSSARSLASSCEGQAHFVIRRILGTVLTGLVLMMVPPVHSQSGGRSVVVTFDDLPANLAGSVGNDLPGIEALTRKLLDGVRRHAVPAIGFVNEGGLFVNEASSADATRRIEILKLWVDAGLELGNHGYSHRDLNTTPIEDVQADVIRGETITRRLLAARGQTLRYFRHPLLHVGADLPTRLAFETFLARRGYTIAPVTIDNDDFVYAVAYARALRRGDLAAAARIGDDYLRYMNEVFSYFEDVSRRVTGREIPQVLLLHANSLNADRFDALAEALVRRGYRFVTLQQALEDSAYRQPDRFVGAPGNSWFNHWEVTAGRPRIPTPAPPAWITAP